MQSKHRALLKAIDQAGGIPVTSIIESKQLLQELAEAGLIKIAHPDAIPANQSQPPEYRLTVEGKLAAQALPIEDS